MLGLQAVEVASSAVITVGTGGTAGVLIGAGYAGVQRLAGEASAVHYGLQRSIDWVGVGFDTAFALIGGKYFGRLGGAVAGRLAARLGGQLAGRLTAAAVSSLLVGRASGILHAVAREVLDDVVRGRSPLTPDALINRIADQLSWRAAFLDLVGAAAGAATAEGTRPATAEPQPPPRQPTALRSIQGGVPGPVPMSGGRVVSAPPTTTVTRSGAVAVGGGALPAPAPVVEPAPAPAPALRPVPTPAPEPVTAATPGSSGATSPSVSTAVATAAAVGPASGTSTAAPQVTLELPPEKAIHANLYGSLIRARQLEHTPNVPRRTAQAANWDRELRPGGPMEMLLDAWLRFDRMGVSENRRLRPDWSRELPRVNM